jgi:ketosteroid isomerase-like protein
MKITQSSKRGFNLDYREWGYFRINCFVKTIMETKRCSSQPLKPLSNMKKHTVTLFAILILIIGCQNSSTKGNEEWKSEILQAEKAFSALSKEKGVQAAFEAFADDEVVLLRGDKLINGLANMSAYFENSKGPNKVSLTWEPTFVDVSESGDLGYTYGNYLYISTDSLGVSSESTGIFHTVWKSQSDGTWKFVWD